MESSILELVRRWQNGGRWKATYELAHDWQKTLKNVNRQHGPREFNIQKENAEILQRAYLDSAGELGQIADLLREHAPRLLHLIPVLDFLGPAPADYRELIAKMLKLEGELLAMEADGNRTADGKTDDAAEIPRIPENPDALKLAKKIKQAAGTNDTKKRIALEFTNGDGKKAESLLRKIREFKLIPADWK